MPFRYANQDDVLHELSVAEDDTSTIGQLERIENALADAFDRRVGRTWGIDPVPSSRTIVNGCSTDVVVLARPARSIVSVAHGGTFNGSGWADETVETTWHERYGSNDLIYGIERVDGSWPNRVRVNAIWADDSSETVPADVSFALTWLTIRQYRKVTASPMEVVGPEGFTVPTPDAWNDATVKTIIDKYRVVEVVV